MLEKKKGTILVTLRKREAESKLWTSLMDPWPEDTEEDKMVIDEDGCGWSDDRDRYSELITIASKWEAVCKLLREVRKVSDMVGYGGMK